jgi:hypothetical protein
MKAIAAILLLALTGPTGEVLPADVLPPAAAVDGGNPDAGTPAIFALCVEPDAGDVAQELDGGYFLLSPARASFDACRIGAVTECSKLLQTAPPLPDAGIDQKSTLWLVTSTVCALSGAFSAYANNRSARHLGLWP